MSKNLQNQGGPSLTVVRGSFSNSGIFIGLPTEASVLKIVLRFFSVNVNAARQDLSMTGKTLFTGGGGFSTPQECVSTFTSGAGDTIANNPTGALTIASQGSKQIPYVYEITLYNIADGDIPRKHFFIMGAYNGPNGSTRLFGSGYFSTTANCLTVLSSTGSTFTGDWFMTY